MDSFSRRDYNKLMRLEKDNTDSEILALEHLHLNGFNLIELPKDIGLLTRLNSLYLSFNNIETIIDDIGLLINLETLVMDCNNIKEFPTAICKLTKLNCLDITKNKLLNISKDIKNLQELTVLLLSGNNIKEVPEEIEHLGNLKTLYLSQNIINDETSYRSIFNLTNLTLLNLSENICTHVPENIKNLTKLTNLYLSINIIPINIKYLRDLKDIDLTNNKIEIIPHELFTLTNIVGIYFSNNNIREIPDGIGNLHLLEYCFLNNNKLKSIPISIINCNNLHIFTYDNNEIEYVPPQIVRFLNRLANTFEIQVYNDGQNIHNHSIQQSINTSISKIMAKPLKTKEDFIMNEILMDTILTSKTKELLIEYSNNSDYHSVLLITFKELLFYIWELIQENEHRNEIKAILNIEISDAECKCFTGRLTRLLNCLNGFNDLIEIQISDNQQIGNIIVLVKNELDLRNDYTIAKHKQLVKEELRERGYDDKIIEEWIEYI